MITMTVKGRFREGLGEDVGHIEVGANISDSNGSAKSMFFDPMQPPVNVPAMLLRDGASGNAAC